MQKKMKQMMLAKMFTNFSIFLYLNYIYHRFDAWVVLFHFQCS